MGLCIKSEMLISDGTANVETWNYSLHGVPELGLWFEEF